MREGGAVVRRGSAIRRFALPAALCLAGGAAATVMSAWAPAAVWGDPIARGDQTWGLVESRTDSGFVVLHHSPLVGIEHWLVMKNPGMKPDPKLPVTTEPRWVVMEDSFAGLHTFGYGWPARCARMVVLGGSGVLYTIVLEPFWHWSIAGKPLSLPAHPVWWGVLINTAVYAAILAGLLTVPRAIRTRFRLRRGLCPGCGYDLAGNTSGICPECGAPAGVRTAHHFIQSSTRSHHPKRKPSRNRPNTMAPPPNVSITSNSRRW